MKTDSEFVAFIRRQRGAYRRRETVLAIERAAVGAKPQRAVVDHVKGVGVTIMRDGQIRAVRLVFAHYAHVVRSADDRRAEQQPP